MLTLFHDNKQYPLENSEYYIRELANGLDECIFTINIHDPIYAILAEEEQITDRGGQRYKVKQIDGGANDAKVVCQLDIDAWRSSMHVNYNSGTKTCYNQISAVLPAGWSIVDKAHINIGRTLEGDLTPLDVCIECTNVYGVYIRWDNKAKTVTIYPKTMGAPVGAFATRELNLKEINYKGKSNDIVTRLYAYGKDGLSFASINSGKEYIDNFTYTSQVICGIWRDDRYEVKQNLLDDARAKLAVMSKPERTYECSIVDLQATNPELYNNLDFSLFTAATLIDDVKDMAIDYQVVERHVYPYHPEMNEVIFNSEPLKITATVTNVVEAITSPNSTFQQIQAQKIKIATDWLTSGEGYVVAKKGTNGQWSELLFMDDDDESTAQQVLRINTNGLGFSTTGINGPYTNAWTIDGSLVADFITTGHMELDRLRGGTAILGGGAGGVYGNGTLTIKDASNNNIASISNTGITFNSDNFKVDNQGKMTAKSATIEGNITVGGSSNVNGSITIKNASGSSICTINNAGINYGNNAFKVSNTGVLSATGADIKGTVTVGGNSNADGSITVNNSSGSTICTINNAGINYGNGAFKVNATGNLTATGVDITGKIVSQSGSARVAIENGALTATSLLQAGSLATVNGGYVRSDGDILANGDIEAKGIFIADGAAGTSGNIGWVGLDGSHGLSIKNGLVVGIS